MKIFKLIKGIGVASLLIMVSLESSIVNAATSNATRMEEDGYTLLDKKFDYQNVLQGKTMYAFGDSIVAGHKYPLSFVDFVTQNQGMKLKKYARNGAVICSAATDPMGGYIMNQVKSASLVNPDYVVFDGGTNDAENIYNNGGTSLYNIGTVTEGKDSSKFDTKTFAGSFEKTLYDMENKWHSAKIVYVAVHKLGSRDWKTQLAMREVELAACKKWGVIVADVFGNTNFDTRNIEMKDSYTFNNLNSSGVPGNNGSGTHPNLAGIKKYYLPVLTTTLLKLAISDISY
ncbi:SGNH/GDSL hydrolase family protein [Clostridium sp. SHJSY1]|uniref:SGNH/GDSL hydrolase family protein n=1 Tax=Clostridium sp. SHJSY1 TaxID=2942483 RepID=UPI00287BA563|nr:SGNH/GDSL hydrolase family protein [Clostridium sp. SHJSY1]